MKVFGIAGWSGSGKTTLVERLVATLAARGLRVAVVKHAHHDIEVDVPGKDSWRHRQAGATEVLVASPQRWALMHELRGAPEPALPQLLAHLAPCDVALVEGFRHAPVPKLEVHRRAAAGADLWRDDPHVVAVATDEALEADVPQFPLDDVDAIAAFVVQHLDLGAATAPQKPRTGA
ncbi:MAG: molybdopterin-guanine dinucleotide biosynthesis protein B [Burkholderiales bacterium]|nr:molybdopterin-guanine dinucleotide biosynthesis protein B [Burkholderiales bacterium]